MKTNCKHWNSTPFSAPFEVVRPTIYKIFVTVYFIMLLIGLYMDINLLKTVCMENEGNCIFLLTNTILRCVGIWVTKDILSKQTIWIKELNRVSNILDNLAKDRNLIKQLTRFSLGSFRIVSIKSITVFIQILILIFICAFSIQEKGIIFLIPEITLMLSTLSSISVFSTVSIIGMTFKRIFDFADIRFCQQIKYGHNLSEYIEEYKRHIWSTCYTWKMLNTTVNSSSVICLICYIAMIILNIYAVIIELKNESYSILFISWYRITSVIALMLLTVSALDQERRVSLFFLHFK